MKSINWQKSTLCIGALTTLLVAWTAGVNGAVSFDSSQSDRTIKQIANTSAKSFSPDEVQSSQSDNQENAQVNVGLVSEAFGHLIVKNLDNPGFKFDIERVIKGMRDELAGKPSPLSDEEYEQSLALIQEKIFNEISNENLKEAEDFLQKNSRAEGVVTLIPGKLEYKIIKQGNGPEVELHSTPSIHYTGSYLDGTVFGSSADLNEPIRLPLDQTISGFSKGIVGMKEGEKRILYIHPDLGYGVSGQLPPNTLLIFEIEVVKANNPSPSEPSLKL